MKNVLCCRRLLLPLLMILLLVCGCAAAYTATLDTVFSFTDDGCSLEATARELVVERNEATVRVSFVNRSGAPIPGFSADVLFLDEGGATIGTETVSAVFEVALPDGDSTALTVSFAGRGAQKVRSIHVRSANFVG